MPNPLLRVGQRNLQQWNGAAWIEMPIGAGGADTPWTENHDADGWRLTGLSSPSADDEAATRAWVLTLMGILMMTASVSGVSHELSTAPDDATPGTMTDHP